MAIINAFAQDAVDRAEPLSVADAYAQCRAAALAESVIGVVGLEIESHLVDLDHVADPVPWKRVEAIAAVLGKVAPGSAVTVEPGGQKELSQLAPAGEQIAQFGGKKAVHIQQPIADQNGGSARDQEDTTHLGIGMATGRASCMNIQACLAPALRAHG